MNAEVGTELPRYQSHKKVWALKIKEVTGCTITPADQGYAAFMVDHTMYARYTPVAGDYYVVYQDGYQSFSPAKAFEDGYTRDGLPGSNSPDQRIKRLERELQEYIRVEKVMVECNVVSRDRLDQAHGMVRDLMDLKG